MKKVKLIMMTLMMCLMTSVVFGQWTYGTSSGMSGGKYSYTETNPYTLLAMYEGNRICPSSYARYNPSLVLYAVQDSCFCDCDTYIDSDFVLVVNGVDKKYKLTGETLGNIGYRFYGLTWTDELLKDFKSASNFSISVNQDQCHDHYYQFDFSGSEAAYNFITK